MVGSFLNVVIHRVPRGESLIHPGSHCPACGTPIKPWHNVPVLGWLVLRGRCANCGSPISVRYPLVELVTAVLFAAVTWRLAGLSLGSAIPAYLYFTAIGVALAAIDLDVRRLPNAIVLPSYPVLAGLLAISAAWQHDWWPLLWAVVGGLALFGLYLVLVLIYPAGMGFGDVRLAGIVGGVTAYLSWSVFAVGAFAGFLLGAVAGLAVIAARRGDRRTALPFGPFMIAGALLAIFVGEPVAAWYLDLLGR
ncbi:prepilin peptidase [Rhizocola hellebori]|uniref:Prepilin peptidase n=1 Tax=Rhizocola hellebori TaxID=1392758 RepID=A0A8J3VFN9_9ACTN|nr:prepilin peptidase [Rhizocola hellebori]